MKPRMRTFMIAVLAATWLASTAGAQQKFPRSDKVIKHHRTRALRWKGSAKRLDQRVKKAVNEKKSAVFINALRRAATAHRQRGSMYEAYAKQAEAADTSRSLYGAARELKRIGMIKGAPIMRRGGREFSLRAKAYAELARYHKNGDSKALLKHSKLMGKANDVKYESEMRTNDLSEILSAGNTRHMSHEDWFAAREPGVSPQQRRKLEHRSKEMGLLSDVITHFKGDRALSMKKLDELFKLRREAGKHRSATVGTALYILGHFLHGRTPRNIP